MSWSNSELMSPGANSCIGASLERTWSCFTSDMSSPSAELTPGVSGTSSVGMPRSSASLPACMGPAPPKATRVNSRMS